MNRLLLTLLITCICTINAHATIVQGTITNIEHKPVPFAIITIVEANMNITANEHGKYQYEIPEGKYEILCESIDYAPEVLSIEVIGDTMNFNIQLKERINSLEDVVIYADGEDPAIYKMRQVIKNKSKHQKSIQTIQADIYLKGALSTTKFPKKIMGQTIPDSSFKDLGLNEEGKGIIYLLEQNTNYYYQAPNKQYNHIKSVRTSGDPQGLGFAQMPPIINIYNNNVEILNGLSSRGFVSPAHNNAFWYYDFKLETTFFDENDRLINKIKVIPKRKYEPLFSGFVYVVEDEWVFKAIELQVDKYAAINIADTVKLQQTYTWHANKNWVIKSQNMGLHINIFGFGIDGNFITNYNNLKVNNPIDPQIFNTKFISTYDTNALSYSQAHWDSTRQIPLTEDEQRNFVFKDSQRVHLDSLSQIDSHKVTHQLGVMDWITGTPTIGNKYTSFRLNNLLDMPSFNTVEGLAITVKPSVLLRFKNQGTLNTYWHTRYGFSAESWYNKIGLRYHKAHSYQPSKNWTLQMEGGKYVQDITGETSILPLYNSISTLLYGKNHLKLYEKTYFQIDYSKRFGNGLSIKIGVQYEDRVPLENTTNYTWNKEKTKNITPNNPSTLPAFQAHQAAIASIDISYQPGWKYIQYPTYIGTISSNAPTFNIGYTKGFHGILGSDVDFDKWNASIQHQFSMNLLGNVQYSIAAGGFLNSNKVGNPDMKHFIGNELILASPYMRSFQIAPYYRFSTTNELYTQAHVEWHLGGLLSNKIPLLRQLNWHIVTGSNALYTFDDNYYAEIFVGLENIGFKMLRPLRVDFVLGYVSGLAKPSTGIRVGINK